MTAVAAEGRLTDLYRSPGPFITVLLDATRSTEAGAREVELRWRALRAQLSEQGADAPDLDALDAAIDDDRQPGRHGRALVAADGEVLFSDVLPEPPRREFAVVAPLPHLMPYVAQRGHRIPYLLVVTDRTGADIAVPPWIGGAVETVEGGDQFPTHKTGRDDWSELHFQHRVENAWEHNARDVADVVARRARAIGAELVIVAGDERARAMLDTQLQKDLPRGSAVIKAERGGRGDGASEQALQEAVHEALLRAVWRRRRELLEHLQQNLGRAEYAVAGVTDVVDALRRAAVDTLVISDDPSSTLRAFVGPEPVQFALREDDVRALGVADPEQDRLDAALVRAVVGTGARLVTTPNAHDYLPDGIGALLRYDDRAGGHASPDRS
jgi:phosphoglycolate phosphatase-like HAD superfamily hydrolase